MAEKDHGILGPSKAKRWLVCHPSAQAEFEYEQKNPSEASSYATEGTTAHDLWELILLHRLERISHLEFVRGLEDIQSRKYWDTSMQKYCAEFVNYVIEIYESALKECPHAEIVIEYRIDYSVDSSIPNITGTVDVAIIAEGLCIVIDFKYGKGVYVSAINNPQLKIYAAGISSRYDYLFTFKEMLLIVYQPRIDNISTYIMQFEDLMLWNDLELASSAVDAWEKNGDYIPGEHCQFCKIRPICRASANQALKFAENDFYTDPALLDDSELVEMYDFINNQFAIIKGWAKALVKHMLLQTLSGRKYDGLKLVAGRGKREIINSAEFKSKLIDMGYRPDQFCKPQDIKGITELEKLIGKKKLTSELSDYIVKKDGPPTLVSEDDKRPEWNGNVSGAIDFANTFDEDEAEDEF